MSTRSGFPILLFANFMRDDMIMVMFKNIIDENLRYYYKINPNFQWFGLTYRTELEYRLVRNSSYPRGTLYFSVGGERFVACDGLLAHVNTGNILICSFINSFDIQYIWVSSEFDSVKTKFTALRKTWRKIRSNLITNSNVYINLKDQETMNSCKHTTSFHFKSLSAAKSFKQDLVKTTLVTPTESTEPICDLNIALYTR